MTGLVLSSLLVLSNTSKHYILKCERRCIVVQRVPKVMIRRDHMEGISRPAMVLNSDFCVDGIVAIVSHQKCILDVIHPYKNSIPNFQLNFHNVWCLLYGQTKKSSYVKQCKVLHTSPARTLRSALKM